MINLFDREIQCPVCEYKYKSKQVKRSAISVKNRDEDYCAHYRGDNPMFYNIFVCPSCGFSSFKSEFELINDRHRERVMQKITCNWNNRDFTGVRTLDEAIETYKLALLSYMAMDHSKNILGKVCLRIAWLYRYKEDLDNEMAYIKHAADFFQHVYENEDLEVDKENELLTLFLLGELNRRLKKYQDSIFWFDKLLKDPAVKQKRHIEKRARDQWQTASDEYKKCK